MFLFCVQRDCGTYHCPLGRKSPHLEIKYQKSCKNEPSKCDSSLLSLFYSGNSSCRGLASSQGWYGMRVYQLEGWNPRELFKVGHTREGGLTTKYSRSDRVNTPKPNCVGKISLHRFIKNRVCASISRLVYLQRRIQDFGKGGGGGLCPGTFFS